MGWRVEESRRKSQPARWFKLLSLYRILVLIPLLKTHVLSTELHVPAAVDVPNRISDLLVAAYAAGYNDGYTEGVEDCCSRAATGEESQRTTSEVDRLTDEDAEAIGSLFCAEHISAHELAPHLARIFVRRMNTSYPAQLSQYASTASEHDKSPPSNRGGIVHETLAGTRRVRPAWSTKAAKLLRLSLEAVSDTCAFRSTAAKQAWERLDKWGAVWFDGPVLDPALTALGAKAVRTSVKRESAKPINRRQQQFMGIIGAGPRHDYPLRLSCAGMDAFTDGGLDESLCAVGPRLLEAVVDAAFPILQLAVGADAVLVEASSLTALPGAKNQPRHADSNEWSYDRNSPTKSSALMVTVFVPLVEVAPDMGALDLWLGTHTHFGMHSQWETQEAFVSLSAAVRLSGLSPGSMIVMDSRLQHRGSAHTAETSVDRPVAYVPLSTFNACMYQCSICAFFSPSFVAFHPIGTSHSWLQSGQHPLGPLSVCVSSIGTLQFLCRQFKTALTVNLSPKLTRAL